MPRQKQDDLPEMKGPGVERPVHKDIDRLADQLHDKLEERATISTEITKLTGKIIDKMKEYGLSKYFYRDQEVDYKPGKESVKIKAVKAQNPEPDSEPPLD